MYIDALPGQEPVKTNTYSFYGLNRTRKGRKGEFEDMENMSTDEYPYASPTPKPFGANIISPGNITLALPPLVGYTDEITGFTGIANEKLYYNGKVVSGSYILYNTWQWNGVIMGDVYIINGVSADRTENIMYSYERASDTFSVMGASMDKLIVRANDNYISTAYYAYYSSNSDEAHINYSVKLSDGTEMCIGDFFDKYGVSKGEGNYLSSTKNIFSQYFAIGDEVTISGFPYTPKTENTPLFTYDDSNDLVLPQTTLEYGENNTRDISTVLNTNSVGTNIPVSAVVKSFGIVLHTLSGSVKAYEHRIYFDLKNKNGDAVEFYDMGTVYCMGVKLSLKKPSLSRTCTHNGRIFGTHTNGRYIYGSSAVKLYDFSADSITKGFAARLSDFNPGTFTGICEYGNLLLAFKEQSITVIGGDNPENYYTDVINGIGCIDPKSIAVTPQGVIFLSYNGIYRYSGNVPVCISEKLNVPYKSGTAGFDGQKYYLSSERADTGEKELIVYDTRYGLWHKYSDNDMLGMFVFKGQLWEYTADKLYCRHASNGYDHNWTMTSMRIYDYTLNRKAPESIWIKAELSEGASFCVETSTDDNEFVKHLEYKKPGLFVVQCPCRIKMGNYYRYRISGTGKVVFYELEIHRSESGREQNAQRQMHNSKINEAKPLSYQNTNPTPKYIY